MGRNSKFSLADVLTLLASIGFGYIVFLGVNFSTLGDIKKSILIGFVTAFLLFVTAYGAKLFKQVTRNFKTAFAFEITLLVLFVLLSGFFSYVLLPHYFVVSDKKNKIQNELKNGVEQSSKMYEAYDKYVSNRKKLYKEKLESVKRSKKINKKEYRDFGFGEGVTDKEHIENKMFTINADLYPTNYVEMKQRNNQWMQRAKETIGNWKAIGIVDVVNKIEVKIKQSLQTLQEISKIKHKGDNVGKFKYDYTLKNVKTDFKKKGKPTLYSILTAFVLVLLMIFSYFIANRSSKTNIGVSVKKGKYDIYII